MYLKEVKVIMPRTSKRDASIASKLLRSKRTSKNVKSVAGSDLSDRRKGKRK
jgi:hypothetical protein